MIGKGTNSRKPHFTRQWGGQEEFLTQNSSLWETPPTPCVATESPILKTNQYCSWLCLQKFVSISTTLNVFWCKMYLKYYYIVTFFKNRSDLSETKTLLVSLWILFLIGASLSIYRVHTEKNWDINITAKSKLKAPVIKSTRSFVLKGDKFWKMLVVIVRVGIEKDAKNTCGGTRLEFNIRWDHFNSSSGLVWILFATFVRIFGFEFGIVNLKF